MDYRVLSYENIVQIVREKILEHEAQHFALDLEMRMAKVVSLENQVDLGQTIQGFQKTIEFLHNELDELQNLQDSSNLAL